MKHLRRVVPCPVSGIDWQVRPPGGSARTGSPAGSGFNRSLANLLVLRGKDVYSAETGLVEICFILPDDSKKANKGDPPGETGRSA